MFALAFLVYAAEHDQEPGAAPIVHAALDWLDAVQDQETGTWGRKDGSSLLNSMAATYHFLPFYEYLQRPIQRLNQPDRCHTHTSTGGWSVWRGTRRRGLRRHGCHRCAGNCNSLL